MSPADELSIDTAAYGLAVADEVYVFYFKANSHSTSVNIGDSKKKFSVSWYDPRNGGALQEGTIGTIVADGPQSLGSPPAEKEKDWVALIRLE